MFDLVLGLPVHALVIHAVVAQWGDRARIAGLIFMVLVLAAVWFVRPPEQQQPRSHPLEVLLTVVVVLASVAVVTTVVVAGHAGSRVVWSSLG